MTTPSSSAYGRYPIATLMYRTPWSDLEGMISPECSRLLQEVGQRLLGAYGTESALQQTLSRELTGLGDRCSVKVSAELATTVAKKALSMGASSALQALSSATAEAGQEPQQRLLKMARDAIESYSSTSFISTLERQVACWIDDLAEQIDPSLESKQLAQRTKLFTPLLFMSLGFQMNQGLRARL
jgi:hypothetical protein